jgi:hypothetical protein
MKNQCSALHQAIDEFAVDFALVMHEECLRLLHRQGLALRQQFCLTPDLTKMQSLILPQQQPHQQGAETHHQLQ